MRLQFVLALSVFLVCVGLSGATEMGQAPLCTCTHQNCTGTVTAQSCSCCYNGGTSTWQCRACTVSFNCVDPPSPFTRCLDGHF
ncbi:MAG: hypothetical protein R3B49_00485 [Phycisphaerales bacterium]